MADTRSILRILGPAPAALLVNQIEQNFATIHVAISKLYEDAQDKSKLELFENVWQQLNFHNVEFNGIEDVNQYYFNLEQNLDASLHDYATFYSKQTQPITSQDKAFYQQLIRMAHGLALRRYIFSQFKLNTDIQQIKAEIPSIMPICDVIQAEIRRHDPVRINQQFVNLSSSLFYVIQFLVDKYYLPDQKNPKLNLVLDDEHHARLNAALNRLPDKNTLAELTQACYQAREQRNAAQHAEHQQRIEGIVATLRAIKLELNQIYAERFTSYAVLLEELHACCERISIHEGQFAIQENFKRMIDLYELATGNAVVEKIHTKGRNQLIATADAIRGACKDQRSLPHKLAFGFVASPWEQAGDMIYRCLSETALASITFIEAFAASVEEVKPALQRVKDTHGACQHLRELHAELTRQLVTMQAVWSSIDSVLLETEAILSGHLRVSEESLKQLIKTFSNEHWLKMVLGGVGGGSLSSILAGLLSLHAGPFALVVIATAILGAAAGASIGAVREVCRDNPQPEPVRNTVSLDSIFHFWHHHQPASALPAPRPAANYRH